MDNFNYKSHCADMDACMGLIIDFIKQATSFKGCRVYIKRVKNEGSFTNPESLKDNVLFFAIDFADCNFNKIGTKEFFNNFYMRAELPEFSILTLTLLHELGHNETEYVLKTYNYDRDGAIQRLSNYKIKNVYI